MEHIENNKRVKLTDEEKLEHRRRYARERNKKRYHEENEYKTKILNRVKQYHDENKEAKKIKDKEYYERTKEARKEYIKEQNDKAKDRRLELKLKIEELTKLVEESKKIV